MYQSLYGDKAFTIWNSERVQKLLSSLIQMKISSKVIDCEKMKYYLTCHK